MPIVDDKLKLVQNAATFEGLFNAVSNHSNTGTKFFRDDLTWGTVPPQFQNVVTIAKTGYGDFVCSDTAYTSDDQCIQAALDAAEDGQTIIIFGGTYTLLSAITQTGKDLTLIGYGNVIFNLPSNITNGAVKFTGTLLSTTTLTSDSLANTNSITLTGELSLRNGDLVRIYNTEKWYDWSDTDDYKAVKGELYQILSSSVVSSTTQITLTQNLLRVYLATNTTVMVYRPIKINIQNIKFVGPDPEASVTGVKLSYCANSDISHCDISKNGYANLNLSTCYGITVRKCNISAARHIVTGEELGYGIVIQNACALITITDNIIDDCRHCVTSGESEPKGLNRRIIIHNNHLASANLPGKTAFVIDAHQMTIDYTVTGNDIYVGTNTLTGLGEYAIIDGCYQCIFSNNTVYGGGGYTRRGTVKNSKIIINGNNILANGRGLCEFYSGNYIDSVGGTISITDNIFACYTPSAGTGIVLQGCDLKSVIITGNTINTSGDGILYQQPATAITNSHIQISDNIIENVRDNGMRVIRGTESALMDVNICDNTIIDVNQSNTQGYGIYFQGVSNSSVRNNVIKNINGTMYRFYREVAYGDIPSDNNIFENNTVLAYSNPPVISDHTILQNNKGYNPVGNFTAPTLPATTVAHTNSYGYPCRVTVSGGTVTEITLDAIATGLTSGSFVIPIGGTIAITYSSAPTWKWWGL